jgi:hypothetical protein
MATSPDLAVATDLAAMKGCTSDVECPQPSSVCLLCPDGSPACPGMTCNLLTGQCELRLPECVPDCRVTGCAAGLRCCFPFGNPPAGLDLTTVPYSCMQACPF